jgi:predicted ATPase
VSRWQRESVSSVKIVILLSRYLDDTSGYNMGSVLSQPFPEERIHPDKQGDVFDRWLDDNTLTQLAWCLVTHSENIVLRARLRVAEGRLAPEELALIWRDDKGNDRRINVDKDGNVDWWPEGVFAGDLREVQNLFKAQKENKNV